VRRQQYSPYDNEKTQSKIIIKFISGPNKLATIKAIKEELHISLKEAKDCVNAGQFECTEEQWETMRPTLQQIGAYGFDINRSFPSLP